MTAPLVVVDTNVHFSAIGWNGNPRRVIDMLESGEIRGATCRDILGELERLLRGKLRFAQGEIDLVLTRILGLMDIVEITGAVKGVSIDPADDMVIECAVASNADFIVSGDKRHLLSLGQYGGVRIVSPSQLVAIIRPGIQA